MADNTSSLLEAFESLNRRKRENPTGLNAEDLAEWKRLRREIESVLFDARQRQAQDTREYLRVPVSLVVRYWGRNELKDRYISILGEGGVFVSTVDPMPIGTDLDLEIFLASQGLSVEVKGQVVWLEEGKDPDKRGMGIAFKNLGYEQKKIIYGLVDDNLRQQLLERRIHARVDTCLRLEYKLAEGIIEAKSKDVSLSGMFIQTDHPLEIGDRLNLAIQRSDDAPVIQAIGEVVRVVNPDSGSEKSGVGVRFVEMDPEDRKDLQAYLVDMVNQEQAVGTQERRKYARIERLIRLRYKTAEASITALASDLSKVSVFIQTHECLPVGVLVRMVLVHPVDLSELEISGRVVRCIYPNPDDPKQHPGIAVVFENLSQDVLERLSWFLKDAVLMPKSKWRHGKKTSCEPSEQEP